MKAQQHRVDGLQLLAILDQSIGGIATRTYHCTPPERTSSAEPLNMWIWLWDPAPAYHHMVRTRTRGAIGCEPIKRELESSVRRVGALAADLLTRLERQCNCPLVLIWQLLHVKLSQWVFDCERRLTAFQELGLAGP